MDGQFPRILVLCMLGVTLYLPQVFAAPWPNGDIPSDDAYFKQGWGRALSPTESEHEASRWLREAKDANSKSTALLMRGLARYRRGRYHSAVSDLAQAATGVANKDLAAFFRAESLFHLGKYAEAQRAFRQFRRKFPRSVWRFRAGARFGDCLLFAGEVKAGISALEAVVRDYPDYPHPVSIRVSLADAHRSLGQLDKAAEWLDRIIWGYPEDPQIHSVREMLRAVEALGGRTPQYTPDALYTRGLGLRKRKYFGPATLALQAVVDDVRTSPSLRWRARYQIARTLFQMERYPEAVTSFQALVTDAATTRSSRWAKRWESYSLEHLGRIDQAAEALLAGRGDPKRPTTETLYKIAWLYFDGARYGKAAEYFGRVTKKGGAWARKTRFMRAWLSYRLGDYPVAAEAFKRLQVASRHRADRYGYWLARTLARMGDWDAAAATYRGIIESTPNSYYAYQSRARLDELRQPFREEGLAAGRLDANAPSEQKPEPGVACDADDERPGCRLVHAITANVPEEGVEEAPPSPTPRSKVMLTDPVQNLRELLSRWGGGFSAIAEAYELAIIGESRWAARRLRLVSDELRDFRRASRRDRRRWAHQPIPYVDYREGPRRAEWGRLVSGDKNPRSSSRRIRFLGSSKGSEFWALLRDTYAGLGDHHYARRHTSKRDRVRGRPEGSGNQLWRRRYARAFEPIVVAQSAHYGLDPSFIWALMTVESTYNPWAISRAGARGLMQVMPHTGGLVADRMTWRNFGPALLYEPEVAIEMAAWYFHQLLEKFNGQLPLAIAGYNAGPHRVALWLRRKGHLSMDEFIEEIPYTEAREYTKKVLRYLALYRRIYLGNAGGWVGQVIDPEFRDNINF